jgi:hypothetical protein
MAGNAQGGQGAPAGAAGGQAGGQGQNPFTQQQQMPQLSNQTASEVENLLQYYKQNAAGMPSQYPGSNMAAPGSTTPGMYAGGPVGYANGGPMQANAFNAGMARQAPMPQTGGPLPMAPQTGGVMPMAPQPAPVPVNPQAALRAQAPVPMAQDPRFMQNPGMTPRMATPPPAMPQRPQIQGNPNAMPMQRFGRRGR